MMRALWTASSGMNAQQLNVDTIANNLSNVNTTGYKKERAEFKDLLYVSLFGAQVIDRQGRPVGLQVGHGVRPSAIVKNFSQGSMQSTGNPLDFAIDGEGFFVVRDQNDNLFYTRDGSFKLSIDGEEAALVTSDGYFVQVDGADAELGGDGFDRFHPALLGDFDVREMLAHIKPPKNVEVGDATDILA